MSVRLLVQNVPQNFTLDQFKLLFIEFKGFKDDSVSTTRSRTYVSEVEHQIRSFHSECIGKAKCILQGVIFKKV